MSTQVTDDLIQKPKKVRKVMKVTNQETKLTTEQSSKCKCLVEIAFPFLFLMKKEGIRYPLSVKNRYLCLI